MSFSVWIEEDSAHKYLHRKKILKVCILAEKCEVESSDYKLEQERVKVDIGYSSLQ